MKRILSFILILSSLVCISPINLGDVFTISASALADNGFITPSVSDPRNEDGKHLILNIDGSYGGSLFDAKYGKGAPLNGEFDQKDSEYFYTANDYYNMASDAYRTLIPHFSSYQQTMADTSGIACILMILNYLGHNVQTEYSELALLEKYEAVNKTTVFEKGTTESGLIALVNSLNLGYTAEKAGLGISKNDVKATKQQKVKTFIQSCLDE